jgi:hypothetical protein
MTGRRSIRSQAQGRCRAGCPQTPAAEDSRPTTKRGTIVPSPPGRRRH